MPLIAGERTDVVGGYTLVRPVVVGVRESIWSARDRSGAACTLEICERFDASPESGTAVGDFIERATLLKRVSSAATPGPGLGAGHVASVRDLNATQFGAVFVRDEYGLTGREIVTGKVRLRGDALQEIVSGVLSALAQFRDHAGRPHGSLRPDVVLIDGARAGQLRVGLRSPATRSELEGLPDAAGDEMRRLGLMIFEFVQHRPFREMGGYPVRDGPEWQSLGSHAAFWLGLVNDLLDPSGARLTFDEVRERVSALSFRIDGPGAGVWLGRAGIAAAALAVIGAGVWFVLRPGVEPIRADFVDARFERWLRLTPVVASLRDGVAELETPPEVLTQALARLTLSDSDRERMKLEDPFDIEAAFRSAELYRSFERTIDNPLPDLLDGVNGFVAAEIEAQAGAEEKTPDQLRLETLAGVFERGLTLFDGSGGGDGLLDALAPGAWPARGLVSGLSESEDLAWLDASASGLFDRVSSRVDGAIESFRDGAQGEGFEAATAQDALAGGRLPIVDEFLVAVAEIEAASATVGEWAGLHQSISESSGAVVASSGWPELPDPVGSRLSGAGDPFLASLAGLPDSVGVVGESEGVAALNGRLRDAERVASEVRTWVGDNWSIDGVDLIVLSEWVESARSRIEVPPPTGLPAELARWVDARVELGDEWLAAARSATVIDPGVWAVAGFDLEIERVRALWAEASEQAPSETREAETEIAGASDVLVPRLDTVERRLEALRELPRWSSLEDEARAEREDLRAAFDAVASQIESVYNEVLMPPRALIADWRSSPVVAPSGLADVLRDARSVIGEREIGTWEAWAGDRDDETLKREPQTDELRIALRGVNDTILDAGERIGAILEEGRAYGGFDRSAVETGLAPILATLLVARLEGIDAWDQKASYGDGGVVASTLAGAETEIRSQLDATDAALAVLNTAQRGIRRGVVAGESVGGSSVADTDALRSAAGVLREGPFAALLEIGAVAGSLASVDGMLEIERTDDPSRLLALFASDAGEPERLGIAVAAIRRLDDLSSGGTAWPSSPAAMDAERAELLAGTSSLRGGLPESDWDRLSPALRGIVREWWRRGVSRSGDRVAFTAATDGADSWFNGIDEDWEGLLGEQLLEGTSKFNAGVVRLRSAIGDAAIDAVAAAGAADRDAVPAIDRQLLNDVTARLDEIDALARDTIVDGAARDGATSWVRSFRAALNEARQGRRGWAADDYGPVGAGFAGWRAELDEDAEPPMVRYIKDGGPTVEFRLIEDLPDGGQVFLSTDEVSVAVAAEIMRYGASSLGGAVNEWYEVFDDNPRSPKFRGDLLEGPAARDPFVRGRNESRHRLQPSRRWLTGSEYGAPVEQASYPAYPSGLLETNTADTISGTQGGPPDGFCPVNYIPPRLAREAAESFGCRLPTEAEFTAALGRVPGVTSGRWNLRDASFSRQLAHYEEALAFGVTHYQPGKWSYDGREAIRNEVWQVPQGNDDRLWFYRISGSGTADDAFSGGVLFPHLIGNVAEFVLAAEGSNEVRVMGASAISDPAVGPADVRPSSGPTRGTNGFVDVGFRLAIDADDFGSLGKMVLKQIEESEAASFVAGR